MRTDWEEAADALRQRVRDHGGFLTMRRDALRDQFGIGRLSENLAAELRSTLSEFGLEIYPPLDWGCSSTRIYHLESEIGRLAQAILNPEGVPESALVEAVNLYERANAGKDRRSDDVPWLSALDVYLQLVIGRPPEGWEDLEDGRELYRLVKELADTLGIPADVANAQETVRLAGAVCAYRPRGWRWEGAPASLSAALTEAAHKQKESFDRVLREAAKHLLGGSEIPQRDVELGRIGLRYRREVQGGIGWLR